MREVNAGFAGKAWRWARSQWFLAGLVIALVAGAWWSRELSWLAEWRGIQRSLVFGVMFLMALPLESRVIAKSIRRPGAALLASGISFALVPALSLAGAGLLDAESGTGLLVVAAVPCTLASATVWTARAGGNDSVAMLTTLITNGLCFVVTPLLLVITIGMAADLPASEMSLRLLLLVLVPVVLGQSLRASRRIANSASARKTTINTLAQTGILAMVLIGAVGTWQKIPGDQIIRAGPLVLLTAICLAVHLAAMFAGFRAARWMGMSRPDQIAVGFAGSQKTLMVGLLICLLADVTLIPMVVYHATQLVTDTLIADRLAANSTKGSPVVATS